MKKQTFTLLMIALIGTVTAFSQAGLSPDEATLNAMEKLSFLEGNWTGEGWIQTGPEKHLFTQKETVLQKVGNTVIVIDGKGIDKESKEVIHQAFAVLSFDAASNKYLMRAYRADGNYIDAEARVDESGSFIWGFQVEHVGEVRYTIKNENGKWIEKGEMNRDGTWFPFFGMTLTQE